MQYEKQGKKIKGRKEANLKGRKAAKRRKGRCTLHTTLKENMVTLQLLH
jgi:hypothetical protein